ncbi:MAG: MFS transporter [Candidatus Bathyarchaeota archaeon]
MEQKASGFSLGFYVISVASFLFQLSRFTTRPIFTLYVLEIGGSLAEVGIFLAIQSILMIVMKIPLTMVADRIGHNKMFLIAFIVQITTPLLYAFVPNPTWLYIIPFYMIIAGGSYNQLAMSAASNMAPARRQGDAMGRYMTFMSMGMFVGPFIASALVNYISYRQLYLVTAVFPATGLALFLIHRPEESGGNSSEKDYPQEKLGTFSTLKVILRNKNVLVLTFIRAAFSMTNTVFTSLFAVYVVQELGFTPSFASLLFSLVGFSNAFIKLPAGRVADRVGPRKILIGAFATLIMVYVSVAYATGVVPLVLALLLFGVCWGTRAVTEWATLANTVTPEIKTMAMSYLSSIWGLGATLGSAMVGLVGESLPFSTIFLILAAINVPALPAIAIMRKEEEA